MFLDGCSPRTTSRAHRVIIRTAQAIENLPEPDFTVVDKRKRPYEEEKLWRGLQGFGHLWSDSYQAGSWRETAAATISPERDALRDTHVRKAEVEAHLAMAGIGRIPIDWGYDVVADALESSNALLDFEVPAAAKWLVICGQLFRQGAENSEKSWALEPHITNSSLVPSRNLWKASSGQIEVMSLDRWSCWEGRLRELQEGMQGVVQDAATTALDVMRKAVHAPS